MNFHHLRSRKKIEKIMHLFIMNMRFRNRVTRINNQLLKFRFILWLIISAIWNVIIFFVTDFVRTTEETKILRKRILWVKIIFLRISIIIIASTSNHGWRRKFVIRAMLSTLIRMCHLTVFNRSNFINLSNICPAKKVKMMDIDKHCKKIKIFSITILLY